MNYDRVITPLRFQDLNPVGRAIIVAVAALTAGVAAIAFLTSYGALYAFIRDTGLYSDRLTRLYPLLLDAAFIVAELAAILFGILRGPKGWPWFTMVLTGFLTVWFNVLHAGTQWDRRVAAALPPILMMLAFQVDVAVVRSVMRALGRSEQAFGVEPVPYWNPQMQMPSTAPSSNGQIGQGWGSGGVGTKRSQVEAYLAAVGTQRAMELGPGRVTADLKEDGLAVTERYVREIMATMPSTNGKGH